MKKCIWSFLTFVFQVDQCRSYSLDSSLAVCLSGHVDDVFQRPLTQKSLEANVMKAFGAMKTDIFAELHVDSEKDKAKVQSILIDVFKARKFRVHVDKVSHSAKTCRLEPKHVQMWEDVERCFEHVLQAEDEDHVKYDWVFRARPDVVWYDANAPLKQFNPTVVYAAPQTDHYFLSPRHLAEAAFQSVIQEYRRCTQGKTTFSAVDVENILGTVLKTKGIKHRIETEAFNGVVAYKSAAHPHAEERCGEVETSAFRQELCMRLLYGDRPEANMDVTMQHECSKSEKTNLLANQQIIDKKVLILTPMKNADNRLDRYAATLNSLAYPKELISIGLLVSDSTDHTYEDALNMHDNALSDFASVRVFKKDFHYEAPADRHSFEVQAARRKILAESRNELVRKALTDDIFAVLWLDVDMTGLPSTLIQDLMAVGKPIVAPHVQIADITYDRNSWRENHPEVFVSKKGPSVVFEGYEETKSAGGMRDYLDDLQAMARTSGLQDKMHAVPLDGVGTAVLLVEARVHRHKEVFFPESPYKKRLESEGFGLLAKDHGFPVCGMPLYLVQHFDEWNIARARRMEAHKGMNATKGKCQMWCSRGEHKDTSWDDKCTWKGCSMCKQCLKENSCKAICAEYRNGADESMKKMCVGPKEGWGRPCYPMTDKQGSEGKKVCPSDMKECHPPVKKPMKPKPPPPEDMEPEPPVDFEPDSCTECSPKCCKMCAPIDDVGSGCAEYSCAFDTTSVPPACHGKGKPGPGPPPPPGKPGKNMTKPGGKPGEGPAKKPPKKIKKKVKQIKKAKVKIAMKLNNVDFNKLSDQAKTDLSATVQKAVAAKAGVPESDVIIKLSAAIADDLSRRLSKAGVKIEAEVDVSSKVTENTDETKTEADLAAEATDIDFAGVEATIVAQAKEIEGVSEAATGEIGMDEIKKEDIVSDVETAEVEVEVEVPDDSSGDSGGDSGVSGQGNADEASSADKTSLTLPFLALIAYVLVSSYQI